MEGLEDINIQPSPVETSPMEGLEGISIQPFVGIANMRRIIKWQYDRLQKGDSDQQYLVFARVGVDDLAKIDRARDRMGEHTRLAHYTDIDLLIVKLPSAKHEMAHLSLVHKIIEKLVRMGMPVEEFCGIGANRFRGHNYSKEGDSTFKPYSRRPNDTDWPTIVFESGFSESLSRLRHDARWWLVESGGDVKIVIIISMKRAQAQAQPMLRIEKWELAPMIGRQFTLRSASNNLNNNLPRQTSTRIQQITIVPNTVPGASLVLEFAKIFLRPAVPPESNITFTGQELSTWAARLW
jgi:hypothetical protein